MISDDKPSSPIARSSMENVPIEEFEIESIDGDVEDSIYESPRVATSPIFEVFLKIKPKSRKVQNGIQIHDNESTYEVLDSTTLRTRVTPNCNSRRSKTSRPNSTVVKKFTFSRIFEPRVSQAEFFEQTVKTRILELLAGQSSTVMTYGTTNSGKSYTLYGTPDQPGLIPRSIEYVFSVITCTLMPWYKLNPNNTLMSLDDYERSEESDKKDKLLNSRLISKEKFTEARRSLHNSEQSNGNKDCNGESMYSVWLSFAEIYNENIYDLLDFNDPTKSRPLKLIGEKNGLTHVKGLTTVYATTAFEACQILMAGQSKMSRAFTTLNPKSSRSHTIFTMGLLKYQKAYAPHEAEASTLTFCDLAGSGRSKKGGDNLARMKEARHINNSLLVLGRCLKTVYERQSMRQVNDHVSGPFRESKLTRIFQRALSGHEHVTFIINVDPSTELVKETQSILNISAIARKITPENKEVKRSARETVRSFKIDEMVPHPDDFELSTLVINEEKEDQSTESALVETAKSREESLKAALLKRELEVRQELANHYSNVIQRIEDTWKERTKEVEEEGKDLLKWSVDQIESFYKERIDSILYAKKRKRDELSCDEKEEEESTLYEDLQVENMRVTSKVCALKEALKKLQEEHRVVLTERNSYNYELTLLRKELKDFQNLAKSEMSTSLFNDDGRYSNSLASRLKCLIDEKNMNIQILQKDLDRLKKKCLVIERESETSDEKSLDPRVILYDDSTEMNELREELTKKTADVRELTLKLESCEIELNETRTACKDAQGKNVALLEKIGMLENAVREMEHKCKDSFTVPKPPYYLEEASVEKHGDLLDKSDRNLNNRLSSFTDDSFFGDGTGEPGNIIVQAHIDTKKYNLNDGTNRSKRTSSNISETDSKSFFDSFGTDFRSSDTSSKNDSGIDVRPKIEFCTVKEGSILDESPGWKYTRDGVRQTRQILAECRRKLLLREKEFEKLEEENLRITERYKEASESLDAKSREYEKDTFELKEKLKFVEQSKAFILACLETYTGKNACLECELSVVRGQLEEIMADCKEKHVPRLEELEKVLLARTLEVDEANRDRIKLDDLLERFNKLTVVVDECQKERDDLREQLHQRSEDQATLDTRLEHFQSSIERREERLISMKIDAEVIVRQNEVNKVQALELRDNVATVQKKIFSIQRDLQRSEESRKNLEKNTERNTNDLRSELTMLEKDVNFFKHSLKELDDKQIELNRLKERLREKEQEMSLCKRNRDITIKKYDFLVSQLQEELEKFRESSLANKESANCPPRTRSKLRVSESLKKFTRIGKGTDGNWKPPYLRKKCKEEKSVASTSTFSVSRLSSSHETYVESISDDHERLDKRYESTDQTVSSQTESDVDSDESDSRTTSGCSARTEDDFDNDVIPSGFAKRCSVMSGWMRIRRINARTVLPVCSDDEHDGDRSDS